MALALGIGLAFIGIALALYSLNALRSLELSTVDTRFSLRGARRAPSDLVVVGIGPRTISELSQRFPYPRSWDGEVIYRLKRDGARVIVVDLQFIKQTTTEQDNALIEDVSRAGNVVLGTSLVGPGGEETIFGGANLAQWHARAGAADFPTDPDGVIRRMFYDFNGLRTLGVVAAEMISKHAIAPSALGGSSAWIDFAGPPGTITEVPFSTVLKGQASPGEFAGKIVVIGTTASSLHDVHETPVGGSQLMSGPELVAESIATAQSGFLLQPSGGALDALLIVALGLIAPLAGLRLSPGWAILLSLMLGAAYALSVQLAFDSGEILPFTYPLVALALGCAAAVVADSFGERRQLRALEQALGPLRGEGRSSFFICYRRDQSHWPARILNNALVNRFGSASVFMDRDATDAGQIWPRRIEQAIAGCGVMLVLIGPDWLNARGHDGNCRLDDPSDWVRREVHAGLARDETTVVPVLVDGATMPAQEQLPDALKPLADCNAVALAGEDPDAEIDRLVESIHRGRARDYLARELTSEPGR